MSDSQEPPTLGNGCLIEGSVLARFAWGLRSDPGPTRDHNEDFAAVFTPGAAEDQWDRGPIFVLADGMGGHAAGEIASRVAVETVVQEWTNAGPGSATTALRAAARAANTAVLDAGLDPGRRGMGTTLTAAALSGRELVLGHVGDSRAYLVREGECTQISTDHSKVAEMVRMRLITAEQAAKHPARSQLTRSLGGDPFVQVDVVRHEIRTDDVVILCSDGVWDLVSRSEMAQESQRLLAGGLATPQALADRLVDGAIERMASDNVTAVVVHVTSDQPIGPVPTRRSLFRRNRP